MKMGGGGKPCSGDGKIEPGPPCTGYILRVQEGGICSLKQWLVCLTQKGEGSGERVNLIYMDIKWGWAALGV